MTGRQLSHRMAFVNGMFLAYTVTAFGNDGPLWGKVALVCMTVATAVAEVYAVEREDRRRMGR